MSDNQSDRVSLIHEAAAKAASFVVRRYSAVCEDDLSSETFVRLMRAAPENLGKTEVFAYAFAVARNIARDWMRSKARESSEESFFGLASKTIHTDDERPSAAREIALDAVRHAFQSLDHEERLIIAMKVLSGATLSEIADATGLSIATVHRRARMAASNLKSLLLRRASGSQDTLEALRSLGLVEE